MHYQAYLLRLWREDELSDWRVSLEDPQTEVKLIFPGLAELFDYLRHLGVDVRENQKDTLLTRSD
jgi:hypothetical protein